MDYIVSSDFDLIFTMGASCSKAAKQATLKHKKLIPIVFCGFRDAAQLSIIESETSSGNNVTGLTVGKSWYGEYLPALLTLKPDIRNVILIYNSEGLTLDDDRKEIRRILKKHGINLVCKIVKKTEDVCANIDKLLPTTDAVIVLRDNIVLRAIDQLIKLCNKYEVTLCTSDWYSVDRGAAIGFGFSEEITGTEAANRVRMILEGGISPSEIPITLPAYEFGLKVNPRTMNKQGLFLDEKVLAILKTTNIKVCK